MSEPILHAEPSSRWDYYNLQCRYRHSSPGSQKLFGPRRHPQKASRQLLRESEPLSSRSPYLHCAVSRTLNLKLVHPSVSDISVISLTLIRGFDNPLALCGATKPREGAKDRGEYRQAAGAVAKPNKISFFGSTEPSIQQICTHFAQNGHRSHVGCL